MSRVFRRPMFRGGSTNMNGIMSGIEDRENFSKGSRRERLARIAAEYPSTAIDPLSQFLIQGGLNLVSQPSTGGVLSDIASAAKEPTSQLFQGLAQKGQLDKKLALEGEIFKLDICNDILLSLSNLSSNISFLSLEINPMLIPLWVSLRSALSDLRLNLYSALDVNIL